MATPLLRALRERWPEAEIVAEGKPFLAGLLADLPTLDEFLPDSSRGVGGTWRRSRALKARGFDLAILLPDSPRSALGPWLARIPERVGYSRDPLRRACLTVALAPPTQDGERVPVPMVGRYLALAEQLGAGLDDPRTELFVSPDAERRVSDRLRAAGVAAGATLAVISPGANFGASKLYPPASFASVCDGLVRHQGLTVVLAPGPGEEALAHSIAVQARETCVVLDAPPTNLEELKALIARATLVISNDTGPRHMAVALDVPTVVLMGPTDPRHTASQLERQRVLREDVECSPCHKKVCPIDHRCMTRLSPERVLAAAAELLDPTSGTPSGSSHGPSTSHDPGTEPSTDPKPCPA